MLRTIENGMRRTITAYHTRQDFQPAARKRAAFGRWHSFSSLPRKSDFQNAWPGAGTTAQCRHYSQFRNEGRAGATNAHTDRQQIIDSIAHHTPPSPYKPKFTRSDSSQSAFPETTRKRINSLDGALSSFPRLGQTLPVRWSESGNLLTAFEQLAAATTVFICVGANTADGKTDVDSPVAAAALAHAIFKAGKVAIIVADRNSCRLVRELVETLDPEFGGSLKYISLHAVNGALVTQMANLVDRYAPDAIIHAGVPGRTSEGLYLDAVGNPIGEYNIALDNLLDLGNALQKPTIAIGCGFHQAGFANCGPAENELSRSALSAAHQILARNCSLASLALSEILVAAYTNSSLMNSSQLTQLIDHAGKWRNDPANRALPVRRDRSREANAEVISGKARMPDTAGTGRAQQLALDLDESLRAESINGLQYIHQFIHGKPLAWPQHIEESKLRGRTFRSVCLLDSSAGARITAKPFRKFFRARSTEDLKILCISDDLIAPLGSKTDEEREDFVRKITRHAAQQKTEVIVWQCNTACLENTRKIAEEVEAELRAEGNQIQVKCIDLIDTTAEAIAQYGGSKPTLLATQATAANNKYPSKIREFGNKLGKQLDVAVIGAGSSEPELEGLDWATLVNHRYHLSTDQTVLGLLRREIRRYVEKISLETTSIWLCCTHYPALLQFIEEVMAERLREAGITRKIPIYDPNEFQAEALIDWFRKNKPTPEVEYGDLPPFSVQSTKPAIDLAVEVRQLFGEDVPISRIRLGHNALKSMRPNGEGEARTMPYQTPYSTRAD